MRFTVIAILSAVMVGIGVPAFAELQNVEVGGSLRIRGNYYTEGALSLTFDDEGSDDSDFFVEQRATVNVKADFSDEVTAFVELDSYYIWGDNFRATDQIDEIYSAYSSKIFSSAGGPIGGHVTGLDRYSATDIGLYQAYVEVREMWDWPVSLRIGRQEMQFGSEWLVGNNDTSSFFTGLSFDAVKLTYTGEQFDITAWWALLAEQNAGPPAGFVEKDGDVDFYGVYGSYTGLEDMTIDAYWMYVREADHTSSIGGSNPIVNAGTFELHTIGARVAGVWNQLDYEGEIAYQFGDAYEATNVEYDAIGANGEVGYTFDVDYQPRVFIGGAYLQGPDDDFDDAGFNRLFSDWEYSEFLDATDLSNVWLVRGGASAQVTEKIELALVGAYYQVDEDFGGDDELGYEIGLYGTYHYTEDLYFSGGAVAFFADDAAETGAVVAGNGILEIGGFGQDDDLYYLFIETGIRW